MSFKHKRYPNPEQPAEVELTMEEVPFNLRRFQEMEVCVCVCACVCVRFVEECFVVFKGRQRQNQEIVFSFFLFFLGGSPVFETEPGVHLTSFFLACIPLRSCQTGWSPIWRIPRRVGAAQCLLESTAALSCLVLLRTGSFQQRRWSEKQLAANICCFCRKFTPWHITWTSSFW